MTQTQTKPSSKEFEFHPTIFIRPEALYKLDLYIEAATGEISGFGTVTQLNELEFLIEDVYIFEQESSGGGTEIDGETLAQGVIELLSRGIDPASLRLWWHSHASMGTFFSGTDTDTMDNTLTDAPWMISIVGNKAGSYRVRFDLHRPLRMYADAQTLYIYEDEEADKFCEARSCVKLVDKEVSKKYCKTHEDVKVAIYAEEKEKNKAPASPAKMVYQGKGLSNQSGNGNGSARSQGIEDDWWDAGFYGSHGSGWKNYRDTKYCDSSSCYVRVEDRTKFCEKHDKEFTEYGDYLRNLKEQDQDLPKDTNELGGSYELCDVLDCRRFLEVATSYYKGMVLCESHMDDLFNLEYMFGSFDYGESPATIAAVLEYYLDRKDSIDDGDTKAEEDLLDIIEAGNLKLNTIEDATIVVDDSVEVKESELDPETAQTVET